MKKIMECSQAIAEAVKLCKPAVIPMYPITPQTHIVEKLADFINDGDLDSKSILVESEHSAMSACIGASASGVRTFTASSSQGLILMSEVMFAASGLRLPIVMAVTNRALSAPINIWGDHSDAMAVRDSGWIQLFCESSQEAYDTTIQAFKIAEKMSLPVMVNVDGFSLSHVWEPVDFIDNLKGFLSEYKAEYKLDSEKPVTMGAIAFPNSYMEIKEEQHNAMNDSLKFIKGVNNEFNKRFGRKYGDGLVEGYKVNDAKKVIVAMGSTCGTIRVVVDELRKKGEKVGMLKLKSFRPLPRDEIKNVLKDVKEIKVFDRAISFGNSGPLYTEIKDCLAREVQGFIVGLGGRDITRGHIKKAFNSKGGWLK